MAPTSLPHPHSLTLHIWVLHEQQEPVPQGCADRLGARKEEVQCGQHQVLQEELRVGVVLLLQGDRASGQAHCPQGSQRPSGVFHLDPALLGPDQRWEERPYFCQGFVQADGSGQMPSPHSFTDCLPVLYSSALGHFLQ